MKPVWSFLKYEAFFLARPLLPWEIFYCTTKNKLTELELQSILKKKKKEK